VRSMGESEIVAVTVILTREDYAALFAF